MSTTVRRSQGVPAPHATVCRHGHGTAAYLSSHGLSAVAFPVALACFPDADACAGADANQRLR